MADNFDATEGSGATFAADDVAGVKYPRSKLIHGADGTNDGDVAKTNPLPVGFNTAKDGSGTLYAPLVDSDGHTQVDVLSCASHAVTNAGTFAVQVDGSALTALQLIDDVVFADDAAFTLGTSKGVMMMGFAGTQSVDANDAAALACDTDGALHIADGGNSITVDNGGTFAVQVDGTALTRLTDIETNTDFGATTGGGTEAGSLRVTIASDSTGVLSVDDNGGALTVDNGGTFVVQENGAALTALQLIDDAVYVDDADWTDNASKHLLVGGVYQSAPHTVTDGDVTPFLTDSNGRLAVTVNGTVTVGSHAVTNAGTFAVQVDGTALTRLTDIETNTDSGAVVGNGAAATAQRVTIANDSTGILAGVTTVTTVTTCSTVTTLTGSAIAHDSADSGNPHKIGMKATGAMTARTLVAADDRTDLFAGLDGVAIARPHCPLEDQLQDHATNTDGASTAFTGGFAAPGANIRLYLTTLIIANSSATAVTVAIRDGTAGSTLMTVPVPADTGGVVVNLPVPLKFTANTAAAYDASAAVSTLSITAIGFKSKAG